MMECYITRHTSPRVFYHSTHIYIRTFACIIRTLLEASDFMPSNADTSISLTHRNCLAQNSNTHLTTRAQQYFIASKQRLKLSHPSLSLPHSIYVTSHVQSEQDTIRWFYQGFYFYFEIIGKRQDRHLKIERCAPNRIQAYMEK